MAKEVRFNFEQYDGQIAKACMGRLRKAAGEIQLQAILKCQVGTINRPMRKKYVSKTPQRDAKGRWKKTSGHLVPDTSNAIWTEREIGALRRTIRVVEQSGRIALDGRNIWVMAGNYKTWYALQIEYGRGVPGWKGGAKPFLRPGMKSAEANVRIILEGGHGETDLM